MQCNLKSCCFENVVNLNNIQSAITLYVQTAIKYSSIYSNIMPKSLLIRKQVSNMKKIPIHPEISLFMKYGVFPCIKCCIFNVFDFFGEGVGYVYFKGFNENLYKFSLFFLFIILTCLCFDILHTLIPNFQNGVGQARPIFQ